MVPQLAVSVWSVGRQLRVTFMELDEKCNRVSVLSWPLTYAEACDYGDWATNRLGSENVRARLWGDGWNVYIPLDRVISADHPFKPLHNADRRDTSRFNEYRELAKQIHTAR